MINLKSFECEYIPTDEELNEALNLAHNENCRVDLHYEVWGYPYLISIRPRDDILSVKKRMPRYYGA